MNRFLKHWRLSGSGEAFRAHVVSYADDFVILSRGCAAEALGVDEAVMTRLGLTLNEAKTSLRDAHQERFDFLGYTFGLHHPYKSTVRLSLNASPSKKSVQRLKAKIRDLLVPGDDRSVAGGGDELNRSLLGWSNYFATGHAFAHPQRRPLRPRPRARFLARRHKVAGHGDTTIPFEIHRRTRRGVSGTSARTPRRGPCGEASRRAGCRRSARPVR